MAKMNTDIWDFSLAGKISLIAADILGFNLVSFFSLIFAILW